ncbi:MAG: aminotransferase class V-fold PLP-dependent enzyme [Bacteriovoracaceae bacterium]|nr:aminotransferase class V-fold PLP-dependent enzyme [Bacteroidota bacterium]
MNTSLAAYRSLFPHIQTGKLWLNHAAIGPLNSRTKSAVDKYLTNRTEGTIDDFPQIVQISDRAKKEIGILMNASADRIGFVNNTSDGLNIIANGLPWSSGDRIVLNDSEFPANVVPFLNLRRLGVEIDFIKSRNGEITLDDITAAITPRTRLLSISFVQFLSGFRSDLTAIGALCKRHGIIFCVDAIQGIGSTPIDVKTSQVDFLSCGGHKWMLSMMGLGFVYVSEEMQSRITQQFVGWTSNKLYFSELFNYRLDLDLTARRYENGAQNNAGIAAIGESAALLNEVGIPSIHSHLLDLTDAVISFADEKGIELLTPRSRDKRSGIVTLKVPNAEQIFEGLNSKNIIVSLREGKIRLSPHFYNSLDDIKTVCASITNLMQ